MNMRGVWTALVTPFTERNELDLVALKRIIQDQVSAGIAGIIPCGSTGESATLSFDEKKTVIQTVVQELKYSGVKVFAGTGTNNTRETVELSVWASEQGVDGVMLVTPYYNKPSQAGLEAHFRAVADQVKVDVMLYNVPGRTAVSLTAETIARLASHPRIRAIKEACGSVTFTNEILDVLSLNQLSMNILSGDDVNFLPMLAVGAQGVISVASNLFPRGMVAIYEAVEAGDLPKARALHQRYYPLFRDLFIETNPVPLKHSLEYTGWCRATTRLPLAPLSSGNLEKLRASLQRCEIVVGRPA